MQNPGTVRLEYEKNRYLCSSSILRRISAYSCRTSSGATISMNSRCERILRKIPFSKDTFSAICERLVDLIMQKYENCENIITNIRHITHFLNQSNYNIRKENIPPYSWQNGHNGFNYFISTYNQVTHLLCILENFEISIDEFLDSHADQFYNQLCRFIGQCWLIYPQLNIDSNS